jgi:hypothetical protein
MSLAQRTVPVKPEEGWSNTSNYDVNWSPPCFCFMTFCIHCLLYNTWTTIGNVTVVSCAVFRVFVFLFLPPYSLSKITAAVWLDTSRNTVVLLERPWRLSHLGKHGPLVCLTAISRRKNIFCSDPFCLQIVRFEIFTVVTTKNVIVLDVAPFNSC